MKIDYWALYISRCKEESKKIQSQGWMSEDDIMAASSAAMIAIPGVTILALLADSVKKDKKDRTLIFWNNDTRCRDSTRDLTDNVANLFWPQLMQVKEGLLGLSTLDSSSMWIGASLCDGEDEKSEALATALKALSSDETEHKKCLKIRASIENIVHTLLRVQAFNSRLPEIFFVSGVPDVIDDTRRTAEEEEERELQAALMASMQDNIEDGMQDDVQDSNMQASMLATQAPLAESNPGSSNIEVDVHTPRDVDNTSANPASPDKGRESPNRDTNRATIEASSRSEASLIPAPQPDAGVPETREEHDQPRSYDEAMPYVKL